MEEELELNFPLESRETGKEILPQDVEVVVVVEVMEAAVGLSTQKIAAMSVERLDIMLEIVTNIPDLMDLVGIQEVGVGLHHRGGNPIAGLGPVIGLVVLVVNLGIGLGQDQDHIPILDHENVVYREEDLIPDLDPVARKEGVHVLQ